MLENTDNQRLHERIVEVAALLPGLGAESIPFSPGSADAMPCPPFHKDKLERILNRVYERIADEAVEPDDPRLREMIAEAVARLDAAVIAFDESKVRRILDRLQSRLATDTTATPVAPLEGVKPAPRLFSLAKLRSAAAALLMGRHLSFEARFIADNRGPRALPEGPTD